MKLPNKLFTYKESVLSKFPLVLEEIYNKKHISVLDLYDSVKSSFDNITEFLEILECLYALGKIKYNYDLRRIEYVI